MLGAQSNILSRCLLSACWRSAWMNGTCWIDTELIRVKWVLVCWLKVGLAEKHRTLWKLCVVTLSYRKEEMVAMLHWQTQQNSSSSVHSYHSLQMGLELRDGFLQWTPEPEVWSVTCTSSAYVTLPEPAGSAELHGRASTCSGLGDSCAEAPPPCTRWRTRHFMPPCAHLPTHKHARRIRISNHFKSFFFFIFEYYT